MNIERFTVISLRVLTSLTTPRWSVKVPLAIKGIEISDLGIDVEFQQKRHLSVFAGFLDYYSISVMIVVCL